MFMLGQWNRVRLESAFKKHPLLQLIKAFRIGLLTLRKWDIGADAFAKTDPIVNHEREVNERWVLRKFEESRMRLGTLVPASGKIAP